MKHEHLVVSDRTKIEQQVKEIWYSILGRFEERPNATFFESQGQSISAVQIVARIAEELDVTIDIGDLFEDPDAESFARLVADRAESRENM